MWLWKVLCVSLPLVMASSRSRCYWNNLSPYPYFGTKTPYDTVRGDFRDVPEIKDCEPISIWFMIRHGTRRPNERDTKNMKKTSFLRDEIVKNYEQGRGDMCAQDIDDLRKWIWNPKLNYKTSYLTTRGYQELFEYGRRFGEKFASFLKEVHYSVLRPTSEQRTQGSVKAFVEGLQGVNRTFDIENYILNDPVARPYRYCAKRGAKIINSTKLAFEIQRFQETKEFRKVQENVQKRTGLSKELKPSTIMGMYDLCRFYRSYSALTRSPWCALFSDEDLKTLEYVEDVQHYYRNGYGNPLNSQTGAAGLQDLYVKFLNASQDGHKSFTAYFTHDTMMDMIYSAMGLHEDYPRLSGLERVRGRKWRTSYLTPFAANFVTVLHRCPKVQKSNSATLPNPSKSYRIQFFVNERELHLCTNRVCSWKEFRKNFQRFANTTLDFCDDFTYVYSV